MENIEKTIEKGLLSAQLEGLFKGKEEEEVVQPIVEQPEVIQEQPNELSKLVDVIDNLQKAIANTDKKIANLENNLEQYEKSSKETVKTMKDVLEAILAPKIVERDKNGKIKVIKIQKEN
jgi:uncharacterized protein YlxW (UPF0749 family)